MWGEIRESEIFLENVFKMFCIIKGVIFRVQIDENFLKLIFLLSFVCLFYVIQEKVI